MGINDARRVEVTNTVVKITKDGGRITTNAAAIAALQGGANISDSTLKEWAQAGAFQVTVPVYHVATGTWDTGTAVLWPDGSLGLITILSRSTNVNALGLVDSGSVTHADSGKTVTQAAFTRNADGEITNVPALTVA